MKRLLLGVLTMTFVLFYSCCPVMAAWGDLFPGPEIIGPGALDNEGILLNTLTPNLQYQGVGAITYVYIFDAQKLGLTLEEQFSNHQRPVLMMRIDSNSLPIPSGVLLPGQSYYWYVESIHAPGTKSEAVKISSKRYFSTAKDAK